MSDSSLMLMHAEADVRERVQIRLLSSSTSSISKTQKLAISPAERHLDDGNRSLVSPQGLLREQRERNRRKEAVVMAGIGA